MSVNSYQALALEIRTDPLTAANAAGWNNGSTYKRPYAQMTDAEIATKLMAMDTGRTISRTAVPASEVLGAIDNGAWPTTGANQDKLARVLSINPIDASNVNIRGIFAAIFPNSGASAATNQRLNALSTRPASRAEELGLGGPITGDDVTLAKREP